MSDWKNVASIKDFYEAECEECHNKVCMAAVFYAYAAFHLCFDCWRKEKFKK